PEVASWPGHTFGARGGTFMKKLLIVAAAAAGAGVGTAAHAKPGVSPSRIRGSSASTFPCPIDRTGVPAARGRGHIGGGSETANDGTNVCTGSLSGSYTVNPDGTGTLTIVFTTDTTAPNIGLCPTVPATSHPAIVVVSRDQVEV